MGLKVTSAVVEGLLAEASAAHPLECCGLLFRDAGAITVHQAAANVHPAPQTHFEIDPQALIDAHRTMRQGGRQLVGYYHSHPRGLAEPSATDQAMGTGDGLIWAIVTAGAVRLWRDTPGGFSPLSYTLV